ncbi:hypothetical protein [Radiobacillus sp. PE A8.2]|uniref:hypothetical protein n=1 Tax=Radiobacillus sp. PE A8.2 TaxID=3380349 RepID=UPI00389111A5
MIMISILPILTIIGIGAFVFLILRRLGNAKKPILVNRIKWIFIGYGIVLLCATVLYYFMPKDSFKPAASTDTAELENRDDLITNMYNQALQGNVDQLEGITVKEDWQFEVDGSQLTINQSDYNAFIFVEKKENADNKIDVTEYGTKAYFDNIDVTDLLQASNITYRNNELMINSPYRASINIVKFNKEFTITQFTGEKGMGHDVNNIRENTIIYVQVPADVEVSGDEIEFVQN